MAKDLTVMLDDRPGTLAQLSEALGKANVNIEGVCAMPAGGGQAAVHLLVEDAAGA
ncbi:MAG: ACT domain-containing protein, partial [Gemmatimonadales bacterium]